MDEAHPDYVPIAALIPTVVLASKDRWSAFPIQHITHVIIKLTDENLELIGNYVGWPYEFDTPWPLWFFIGKIISKTLFHNEQQLKWFKGVRVRDREIPHVYQQKVPGAKGAARREPATDR